jgi:hypothetical protein
MICLYLVRYNNIPVTEKRRQLIAYAARHLRLITPAASGAQPGVETTLPLPELRSSSTPYGVGVERDTLYPGLHFVCAGVIEI